MFLVCRHVCSCLHFACTLILAFICAFTSVVNYQTGSQAFSSVSHLWSHKLGPRVFWRTSPPFIIWSLYRVSTPVEPNILYTQSARLWDITTAWERNRQTDRLTGRHGGDLVYQAHFRMPEMIFLFSWIYVWNSWGLLIFEDWRL